MCGVKSYKGKNFSIMGDSISTFYGFVPKTYYGIGNLSERGSGVNTPDDTWWMQVINSLGGKLLANNSYSGSLTADIYCCSTPPACSDKRTSKLSENDVNPDVIMVYTGTNDSGWGVEIEGADGDVSCFKTAYRVMLEKIKSNYPDAEIWCFTLCKRVGDDCGYMNGYCKAIRDCAKAFDCKLIELYDKPRSYETCDGLHPNANGMKTIAALVLGQI